MLFSTIYFCHFLTFSLDLDTNHRTLLTQNIPDQGDPEWPLPTPKDTCIYISYWLHDSVMQTKEGIIY